MHQIICKRSLGDNQWQLCVFRKTKINVDFLQKVKRGGSVYFLRVRFLVFCVYLTTILTSFFGTTIVLTIVIPSVKALILGLSRAICFISS